MSTPAIRLSGQALWCITSKELTLNVMHSITIIYINSISWKIDQNPQDFDKGRGFTPKYPCPLLGKNTGGYLDRQKQAQNVGIGILNHFWHNRTQETICGWTWATLSTHIQYMHWCNPWLLTPVFAYGQLYIQLSRDIKFRTRAGDCCITLSKHLHLLLKNCNDWPTLTVYNCKWYTSVLHVIVVNHCSQEVILNISILANYLMLLRLT